MKIKPKNMFTLFFVFVFIISGCTGIRNDVDFARRCLKGLIKGDFSVGRLIDWTSFVAVGINVGGTVNRLRTMQQKEEYVKRFIESFAFSFRQGGGKWNKFTNWRIFSVNKGITVVATDYLNNKVLLLTIVNYPNGKRKLIRMEWKE